MIKVLLVQASGGIGWIVNLHKFAVLRTDETLYYFFTRAQTSNNLISTFWITEDSQILGQTAPIFSAAFARIFLKATGEGC